MKAFINVKLKFISIYVIVLKLLSNYSWKNKKISGVIKFVTSASVLASDRISRFRIFPLLPLLDNKSIFILDCCGKMVLSKTNCNIYIYIILYVVENDQVL